MKHFWALPAFLRLAIASQHHFNVLEDLHANPQYEVIFSDNVISEESAESKVQAAWRSSSTMTATEPHPTPDISLNKPSRDDQAKAIHDELGLEIDIASYEYMTLQGKRYVCSVPRVIEEDPEPRSNSTKEEEEKELARATERGWQLLKGMEGTCIYFVSGWWSYSFCFNDGVRQFHQLPPGRNVPAYPPVEDKTVQSYILGRFDKAERKKLEAKKEDKKRPIAGTELAMPKMQTKGDMNYLVQHLKGGTECDLTGKERRIEIQFHCEQTMDDRITLIKETATCQYLMVISTPRLCNDVAFLPPQEKLPNQIVCTRVLPAAAIPSYLAEKLAEEEQQDLVFDKVLSNILNHYGYDTNAILQKEGSFERADEEIVDQMVAGNLKVGDIVVGGHAVVPQGKKIEKSVVVGGGKETFIATIAKSTGFIASDAELKKLNIRNSIKEIEGVTGQLENVAHGKPWRLDVVETARGRELRGIIDTEDEAASPEDVKLSPDDDQGESDQPDPPYLADSEGLDIMERPREDQRGDAEHTSADDGNDGEKDDEGSEETYKEEL